MAPSSVVSAVHTQALLSATWNNLHASSEQPWHRALYESLEADCRELLSWLKEPGGGGGGRGRQNYLVQRAAGGHDERVDTVSSMSSLDSPDRTTCGSGSAVNLTSRP